MTQTILIAEDDPVQQATLTLLLERKLGYRVVAASHGRQALDILKKEPFGYFSAVLLDVRMPEMDGFETLRAIRQQQADLPVLMLTGDDDISVAVKAIKEGANDFIVKPPAPAHLEVALSNAIRLSAAMRELGRLKRDKEGALGFADLIGAEGGLAKVVAYGRRASASDVPVLIHGETGTGKELFARAIHGESRRVGAPFVAVNCGAIPANLVESTLFGHEKGAFTGAVARSLGKFREAEGGTLFLDEIGELPLEAQVALLRVLQQKEVEPVGAGRAVKVDVRIISATHRDLKADVAAGRFREDVFFRLNVLPIALPPLCERPDDLLPLAHSFMVRHAAADGIAPKRLSGDAEDYLRAQAWPGNVRELENLMRRALVLCDGDVIDRVHLAALHEHGDALDPAPVSASGRMLSLQHADGRFKTMDDIEQEVMREALAHYDQNITRAAEALSMAKSTFYRKIKS